MTPTIHTDARDNSTATSSFNATHAAWSKFFDKYNAVRHHKTNNPIPQRGPSSHTSRPYSALRGANHFHKPRRARSARDLHAPTESEDASTGRTKGTKKVTEEDWEETLKRLRKLVLVEGVPNDNFVVPKSQTPARAMIWKMLLDVRSIQPTVYLTLLARGPSPLHEKICNDAFRTLATDHDFKDRVDEAALVRVLDAFVWKYHADDDEKGKSAQPYTFSYVQGMNVLAAPFLYVMPSELEAFHCFCAFIENCCPTYVQPTLSGVHRGLDLLERCLQVADPSLANFLRSSKLNAELYAFPSVLTLCACTPPLKQLLHLWDYLLAFGVHLCIPCIVAQLLLMRDELIKSHQPMRLLRQFSELDAPSIVGIATTLVRDLDECLYEDLVHHTIDL